MTSPAVGTFKGFGVTLKQIFRKPLTQQYPEYKRPLYPRFRGRHRLHLHENGLEKCVARGPRNWRSSGSTPGLTDFLQVLNAQRTLLNAENQLAQAHTFAATALVAVYKAVGGTWPIK